MPQLYFSTDISCAWLLSAPVCNFVMQSGSDRACLWPYLARSLDQLNTVLVTHVRRLIEQFQHPIRTSDVSIVFWRINSGSIWTRIGHGPTQKCSRFNGRGPSKSQGHNVVEPQSHTTRLTRLVEKNDQVRCILFDPRYVSKISCTK